VRQGELSSALLDFPVQSIGVGPVTVVTSLAGTADSVQAPLFLSFGDEFGITSFDDLLSYLRYFVSPQQIQTLRDTPPEQRAAAWAAFWKRTDPNPSTPDNEALRDYFKRIATANSRYREEGMAGWLTDRGRVYVTLGEPDQAGSRWERVDPRRAVGQRSGCTRNTICGWFFRIRASAICDFRHRAALILTRSSIGCNRNDGSSRVKERSSISYPRIVDQPRDSAYAECDLRCIVLTKKQFAPI